MKQTKKMVVTLACSVHIISDKKEMKILKSTTMIPFQIELSSLKESEDTDRAEWERDCIMRLEAEWNGKEQDLEDKIREEAKKEVMREKKRAEEEIKEAKERAKKDLEEREERLKSKYTAEAGELEREASNLRENVRSLREAVSTLEEEMIVTRATMKQKDVTVQELTEVSE